MKRFKLSLFIFRRDLRLQDNTGLLQALSNSEQVIPCFIFTPEQITQENTYRSTHAVQFMLESLQDLAQQLSRSNGRLYLFYGTPEDILEKLLQALPIDAVYVNSDYTPYSRTRDQSLEHICTRHKRAYISTHDLLLQDPTQLFNKAGKPYAKFAPFYRTAAALPVQYPETHNFSNYYTRKINLETTKQALEQLLPQATGIYVPGGSAAGLAILAHAYKFKNYSKTHNLCALDTTLLSAHHKFGTVSIRQVYHTLNFLPTLVRQLYWRDFFTYIAFHYPYVFGSPFKEKYGRLAWNTDTELFHHWCTGTTGFPIVDAAMRQLNLTGFMHNRARLIVGSFLIKDLHINWQWGEKYFAQQLTDYDPCVNNGNWQWVASTGADSTPYFRIFNPWLQQKKFDPECVYIKTWLPELRTLSCQAIHNWYKRQDPVIDYPAPLLDHTRQAAIAKKLYAQVFRS